MGAGGGLGRALAAFALRGALERRDSVGAPCAGVVPDFLLDHARAASRLMASNLRCYGGKHAEKLVI